MANYQLLKADIDKKVYQNGAQEITGANLNSVLNAMVTTLGAEYQFAGVATIDTNPGTPDAKVFYIANGKGTYTNFGSLEVTEDEVVVLYWDSSWHKVSTGIASQEKLTELESKLSNLILYSILNENSAEKGLIRANGEIEVFDVVTAYRVLKLYIPQGKYYVRVSKAGTQRGCWKYTDDTFATPITEIWGNESKDDIITFDGGYYAISWATDVIEYSELSPLLVVGLDEFLNISDKLNGDNDTQEFDVPYVNNTLIYDDGSEALSNDYWSTDFIKVKEGDRITFSSAGGSSALLLSGYSSNVQSSFVISSVNRLGGNLYPATFSTIIPRGVKFIKICHSYTSQPTASVHIKIINSAYENIINNDYKDLLAYPRVSARKAAIMFQMDCNEKFYDANAIRYMHLLEDNGIKKSTYVVLPQHLSVAARVSILDGFYANGNEIGIHSDGQYDVSPTSTMTDSQFRNAIATYKTQLKEKGYENCVGFVPLGASLKPSFKPLLDEYMVWALTDNLDYNIFNPNYADAECGIDTNPREIKRLALETLRGHTAEDLQTFVQRAKDVIDSTIANKGYLIFYGHTFDKQLLSESDYTIKPEVLQPIVEYIKTKIDDGLCVVGNTSECLNWYYTPRIGE